MTDIEIHTGPGEQDPPAVVARQLDFGHFIDLLVASEQTSRSEVDVSRLVLGPTRTLATDPLLTATDDLEQGILPVAVFVPFTQTWTLKGVSRGTLLQSIVLAPQEEVPLEASKWAGSARSRPSDATVQNIQDAETFWTEMATEQDLAWRNSGSTDGSYPYAVATMTLDARGGISEPASIQQTADEIGKKLQAATLDASARFSIRHTPRAKPTIDERSTHLIRNPNRCHVLTLELFETVAHYAIGLGFVRSKLQLVVLLPNPFADQEFDAALAQRNEPVLRSALLDTTLEDGFDACRFVASVDPFVAATPREKRRWAIERSTALLQHLTDHRHFYNYKLFQALPSSEQIDRIIDASHGQLENGMFDPVPLATRGARIVVALNATAASTMLQSFVANLCDVLETSFSSAFATAHGVALPVAAWSISGLSHKCCECEECRELARNYELVRIE